MTIDILICTIDDGIGSVRQVLMQPMPDVHYVVSMQHTRPLATEATWTSAIGMLTARPDVTVVTLEGRGLSRNRNHALQHATADIILLADDDCRYTHKSFGFILKTYEDHPEADAICFKAESYGGTPLKSYPSAAMTFAAASREGYSPASVEVSLRRSSLKHSGVRFDERFGLGASFPASEEFVLLTDMERAGCHILFAPHTIVLTDAATTGSRFLADKALQRAKGAVFRYCYGTPSALWRTLKEAGYHFVHNGANPLPIIINMLRGIWTLR